MITKPTDKSHLPALDGLRGLAILAVLVFHTCGSPISRSEGWPAIALKHVANIGWTGVDLFFVLSGFLITRILLDARASTNFFRVFYMRRILRIFPMYYLSLIFLFIIVPYGGRLTHLVRNDPNGSAGHVPFTYQLYYWFNLVNFPTAYEPLRIPILTHYWTLSLEEQFYAVWPAVVYFLNEKRLAALSIIGIVTVFIVRNLPVVDAYAATHTNLLYRLTPFRVDTLLVGSLLAILWKNYSHATLARWAIPTFVVSLAVLVVLFHPDPSTGKITFTVFAFFYASLLVLCLTNKVAGAIFTFPLLREMGKYSYAVYLLHPFVDYWTFYTITRLRHGRVLAPTNYYVNHVAYAVCEICASFAVARLTWMLIEMPILNYKRFFRYRYPTRDSADTAVPSATVATAVSGVGR